jgi:hypothetical protein
MSNFSDKVRSCASIGSGKNVFVRFIYTRYLFFNRESSHDFREEGGA